MSDKSLSWDDIQFRWEELEKVTRKDKKLHKAETTDLENERKEYIQLHNTSFSQNIDERKTYAGRIFTLICAWLAAVFLILILQGSTNYELSDSVLVTLISGTTVNVIGIFILVAKYLFSHR